MKIHIDDVMKNACSEWTRERVEGLFKGESEVDIMMALSWDIPVEDLLYQAFRILPISILDRAVELTVTRCITNHALHCGVPEVELWAQKWLSGEDQSEEAARSAADEAWLAAVRAAGAMWSVRAATWAVYWAVVAASRAASRAAAYWEAVGGGSRCGGDGGDGDVGGGEKTTAC